MLRRPLTGPFVFREMEMLFVKFLLSYLKFRKFIAPKINTMDGTYVVSYFYIMRMWLDKVLPDDCVILPVNEYSKTVRAFFVNMRDGPGDYEYYLGIKSFHAKKARMVPFADLYTSQSKLMEAFSLQSIERSQLPCRAFADRADGYHGVTRTDLYAYPNHYFYIAIPYVKIVLRKLQLERVMF